MATSPDSRDSRFGTDDLPRMMGRYLLLKLLARGGMGEVFLASTTGLEGAERPVVVKVIRREHATDPSFFARFLDEARVQAQLQHSGVAQIVEAAMQEGTGEPFVVVEHVEGKSLGDVRSRAREIGARVGWAEAAAIALAIAEALAHVHERVDASGKPLAIVHRDLSPQNVMVGFGGELKLIDFGTARGQNRRCHTVAGVVFAKPGYVAPEVANGDPGDARVDLYALGIMLWELCTGRRFLQGDAAAHLAAVARDEQNPPPVAEGIGAPAELDAIIAKLTAFDRDVRYHAARLAAADLARVLAAAPALASGERGVRARVTELMRSLFPGEPARSRREFARLLGAARAHRSTLETPAQTTAQRPAPRREDDEPGVLPGTRYRLCREIGHGESSVVFEAEHVDLGRRVALKVMRPEHVGSKEHTARFRREARAMSRVAHPGVPKLHDFGVAEDGRLYDVLELLEGETLETYLAREKGMDWRDALALVDKALGALDAIHAAGIVHRDVKPSNLFLLDGGAVKILDFGLAKTSEESAEGTEAGAALACFGTPEYMAPEQATANARVDARADLYGLGSVLYEMLTMRLPFAQATQVAILDAKIKGSPESPRDRAPARGIPRVVDELVMRALARHPSVRFQSAAEMQAAVRAALEAPVRRSVRFRRLGYAAIGASALLVAGLGLGKLSTIGHGLAAVRAHFAPVPAAPVAAAPIAIAEPPKTPEPSKAAEPAAPAPSSVAAASAAPAAVAVAEPAAVDPDEAGDEDVRGADLAAAHAKAAKPAAKPAHRHASRGSRPERAGTSPASSAHAVAKAEVASTKPHASEAPAHASDERAASPAKVAKAEPAASAKADAHEPASHGAHAVEKIADKKAEPAADEAEHAAPAEHDHAAPAAHEMEPADATAHHGHRGHKKPRRRVAEAS